MKVKHTLLHSALTYQKFVDDKINSMPFHRHSPHYLTVYHNLTPYQMMTMIELIKYSGAHLHMCVRNNSQTNVFVSANQQSLPNYSAWNSWNWVQVRYEHYFKRWDWKIQTCCSQGSHSKWAEARNKINWWLLIRHWSESSVTHKANWIWKWTTNATWLLPRGRHRHYSGTSTIISLPQSLDLWTTRTDELASLPLSLAIQQNSNVGKAWILTNNPIKTSG